MSLLTINNYPLILNCQSAIIKVLPISNPLTRRVASVAEQKGVIPDCHNRRPSWTDWMWVANRCGGSLLRM